jgi:energy-coupling factor transporter ATP-binding protein EcfA2
MIELHDVTYSYPEAARPVLQNLSLTVQEGEFLLVVGPSGSGKSTLLRCLNGLAPHFYGGRLTGRVRVCGQDPVAAAPRQMSRYVGFVFQDPETQFVVDAVEDELVFALENHAVPQVTMRKRVEEVLDQLAIAHLRHRRVGSLSGGEKQRVAIAAVLTLQPRLLVLDEPTSQLDPQAAEEVLDALLRLNHDLGLTIVLSEHRLERVTQYADRILYLPGDGQPPLLGEPRHVLAQIDFTPPLVTLGKALGWQPLPLTLKEARPHAQKLQPLNQPSSLPIYQLPTTNYQSTDYQPTNLPTTTLPTSPSIQIRDLWHAYNGHQALKGVNLDIAPGELVALMGRNGAGKTTLLKHIVGLLKPKQGRVTVMGLDTRQADQQAIVAHVGYVPQNPAALLFADTVRQELDFTRRSRGMALGGYEPLLETLGLAADADRYPRDLSVGERQRTALAAVLVAEPAIILLDEPTRGLDYRQKAALTAFLQREKARGRTVLLATHDVELVAACADRVILLGDGQVVVDGSTREVMTDSLVFASQVNKLFRDARFLTVEDVLERTT